MSSTDTICWVTTCAFHDPPNRCTAGEINVSSKQGSAICDTFVPGGGGAGNRLGPTATMAVDDDDELSMSMGGLSGRGTRYAGRTPMVGCSAEECTHNELGVCFADRIVINGSQADTSYETKCDMYKPV